MIKPLVNNYPVITVTLHQNEMNVRCGGKKRSNTPTSDAEFIILKI